MSDEKTRYPGFNGLGRTAAIWGVPYMAMLVVVVASMFVGVLMRSASLLPSAEAVVQMTS